jgi:hypothetical protein
MTADPRCEQVQARLSDAWFSRAEIASDALAHAASCPACGAHREALLALGHALDAESPPALPSERAAAILARAVAELATPVAPAAASGLPPHYRRELARLLFWALLPLPLAMAWYALLFRLGGTLLGTLLPELMVQALGAAFALVVASWLALVYGAIPFVAHHRALRQHPEVSP